MGLTGLEIFKQLPKTNCRDCGQTTCLAFAMAVATGKAVPDRCPHLSEAARDFLGSASAPPVMPVKIGAGSKQVEIGNESVLFRHDKRFENPTAIAVTVCDTLSNGEIAARVERINGLVFERVGQVYKVDLVAVVNSSGNPGRFAEAAKIAAERAEFALILVSEDPAAIEAALDCTADGRPLVCGANAANYQAMTGLAGRFGVPLAVRGANLEELASLAEKVAALGLRQIVLDSGARETAKVLADQTQIRRQALKKFRPLGYPTITFVDHEDSLQGVLQAGVYVAKYAGVVVLDTVEPADLLALITLRLNLYTDPQKPPAVESKVYEILNPGKDSPVYITTNFSLTYYSVAADVEASRVPGYILPVDTDGTSVLTAWSAGKFTPEKIAEALNSSGIAEKVSHRKVIIPGGLGVLSGRLQEVSGWEVLVGPRESSGIPSFIKQQWKT
ncbi:MAG: acetyl-CoA decarbonylase/synthase complex subunit gamma [Pelotomaculum sp.]|nr:acetyl-CoA decarbonylase/synthase complex subunit gamma [Pelotomaculum sp.]